MNLCCWPLCRCRRNTVRLAAGFLHERRSTVTLVLPHTAANSVTSDQMEQAAHPQYYSNACNQSSRALQVAELAQQKARPAPVQGDALAGDIHSASRSGMGQPAHGCAAHRERNFVTKCQVHDSPC